MPVDADDVRDAEAGNPYGALDELELADGGIERAPDPHDERERQETDHDRCAPERARRGGGHRGEQQRAHRRGEDHEAEQRAVHAQPIQCNATALISATTPSSTASA
jgi:hypothetical protein